MKLGFVLIAKWTLALVISFLLSVVAFTAVITFVILLSVVEFIDQRRNYEEDETAPNA
jgi:hypothetical protein